MPIYDDSLSEDRDSFVNSIFEKTDDFEGDDQFNAIEEPPLLIDLDEVNNEALDRSKDIIEHLSGYYIDARYIQEHPYIKNKIMQEIDNIRRLLKMLSINEKAQDKLIQTITIFSSKSALYSSLTSLQSVILSIQKQLDESVNNVEEIFKKMQDECKESFDSKDKEQLEDGSIVARGTRDFLRELSEKLNNKKLQESKTEEEKETKNNINI